MINYKNVLVWDSKGFNSDYYNTNYKREGRKDFQVKVESHCQDVIQEMIKSYQDNVWEIEQIINVESTVSTNNVRLHLLVKRVGE